MTLADYTSLGLLVPQLRGTDRMSVIQELSQLLHREGRIPDLLDFYESALNREFLVSTDIEPGMAFPHSRLHGLPEVVFALGRSEAPIPWGARPASFVHLVFLVAVPATDSTHYLNLISGFARLSRESSLRTALEKAQTAGELLEVLSQVSVHTSRGGPMTGATS